MMATMVERYRARARELMPSSERNQVWQAPLEEIEGLVDCSNDADDAIDALRLRCQVIDALGRIESEVERAAVYWWPCGQWWPTIAPSPGKSKGYCKKVRGKRRRALGEGLLGVEGAG